MAFPPSGATGTPAAGWTRSGHDGPARKIGALGLRVEKGVTYHGIALNVTTDLADFELIDACGLTDISVTSIARELGWTGHQALPTTASVQLAAERFAAAFGQRLDAAIVASAAPRAVPAPALTTA